MSMRLPGRSYDGGGYVYVIEFNSGTVKVGHTSNPQTRVKLVAGAARPHGVAVTRQWISQPHRSSKRNEEQLLAFCRSRGTSLNEGDFFAEINAADVVTFAHTLLTDKQSSVPLVMTQYGRMAGRDDTWEDAEPVIVLPTTEDVLSQIDQVRGGKSRAAWLHEAAIRHLNHAERQALTDATSEDAA
jgi:hypothetical protein